MNDNEKILKRHPITEKVLLVVLNDLFWVLRRLAEAKKEKQISGKLLEALEGIAANIRDAFWKFVYELTSFGPGQELRLEFEEQGPVILLVGSGKDQCGGFGGVGREWSVN